MINVFYLVQQPAKYQVMLSRHWNGFKLTLAEALLNTMQQD